MFLLPFIRIMLFSEIVLEFAIFMHVTLSKFSEALMLLTCSHKLLYWSWQYTIYPD